ncbi:MAG: hypothetical protein IPJ03_17945 [Ignavibacteriales bacterium]|nr:hypothetical protein [Ignavibacteriales bacterium]
MKLIPKIILLLTRLQEKKTTTIFGGKPKSIFCHRNNKGEVQGLLFVNEDEIKKLQECGKVVILTK